MITQKVIVIGGGGHSKVVIDILQASDEYEIVGFTSNSDTDKSLLGIRYLGDDSILSSLYESGVQAFIVAIGDNKLRKKIFDSILKMGFEPVNAISPFAHVSKHAKLGRGIVISPGAVINACSEIGDNVIINTLAGIDHDCYIGSNVHIAPRASLAGSVIVGDGSFIGAGCTVIPETSIGEWTVVGAGAVVISDLPSNVKAVGVPAKKYI
ncbi:acetyltransferase [Paenibacillus sp. FJAT-27812]|uniref:acetyltransferase n=1 Tax=Paenibacillus sp. FJAT-27812 TaxID=1684143 RepID=UPI001E5AB5BF|nr:acetyltransferase [Paenibacillus sp. FJAT-27812]